MSALLDAAIKRWEGFAGELHDRSDIGQYIAEWNFTWRMRRDAGEFDDLVYADGLTALNEVEKAYMQEQVQP